ncbi:Hypothetical protein BHY_1055 (plasmid) [Borrelia nietonii YOR]|uniref:Uncharacterized protein n=2 Tax=Borrelia TaxID=138 RepID=W5SFV3_9SPIR|nr:MULTISPECIES: hypothetical protein [Borrelia]AHH04006.1 Hypothetical protein BHY_1055 [Borrelia nietonii YOR]AHH14572.1 Hypothetical protein BHW_0022300 [Borrelia hermsii MTW]
MGAMKAYKLLILLMILFCCCEDEDYVSNLGLGYDYDDIASSDLDIGLTFDHPSLENLIVNFNLSGEERIAVRFLRSALTDPTIAEGAGIRTYSDDEFYEFLVILGASKTKEAIADIIVTLRVRDEILNAIYEFADGHSQRDTFEIELDAKEREYLKTLKIACGSDNGYKGAYMALKLSDCSEIFIPLKRQVYDVLHKY